MNYQKEAAVTESPQFHSELVRLKSFESALTNSIYHLRRLDRLKKTLFYGKTDHNIGPIPKGLDTRTVPGKFKHADGSPVAEPVRIIHGMIGVATEACEMLELLMNTVKEEKPFDEVNLAEECGDVLWYIACCLNSIGLTFEQVQAQNIAKLRTRYPNKFTEFDAINRDLLSERVILEDTTERMQLEDEKASEHNAKQIAKFNKIKESDGDMLNRLGVDADAWAKEFIKRTAATADDGNKVNLTFDLDHIRAWFANAIMRAMDEQRWRMEAKEKAIDHIENVLDNIDKIADGEVTDTSNLQFISPNELKEFCGYLTAAIPELSKVHPSSIYDHFVDYAKASCEEALKRAENDVAKEQQQVQDGTEA